MEIVADLQLHSRFSRACSKNTTLQNLEENARIKGLNLLSTGDFQHPKWNKEIKENLEEDDKGILWSKNKFPFMWGTEISLMYSDEQRRAVHLLVYAPNGEIADQIIGALLKKGRIDYDGRPIFGMSAVEFVELMKNVDKNIEIIPAHCMTSWFGVFGSKSGFNSLKECFKDKVKEIHAIETGMSADPEMLWRLKEGVNLVSFSDAHSYFPWRIGREATVFEMGELSSKGILDAMKTGNGLKKTIETYPEYGKYHFSGHRNCNVIVKPKDIKKKGKMCPVCNKELTIGVDDRIEELAKESKGYKEKNGKPYVKLVPLHELISAAYGIKMLNSKKIWGTYNSLIEVHKNEFNVLLKAGREELNKTVDEKIVNLIIKNRNQNLDLKAGYDGVYGEILLKEREGQKSLGSS
jgi:uncharacterized protein (TIGR00375 family)